MSRRFTRLIFSAAFLPTLFLANNNHLKPEWFVFDNSLGKELTPSAQSTAWRSECDACSQQLWLILELLLSPLIHNCDISTCVCLKMHVSAFDFQCGGPWFCVICDN